MKKQIRRVLRKLDRTSLENGRPFAHASMLRPRPGRLYPAWTHLGVMIPDLPKPYTFFDMLMIAGLSGHGVYYNGDMLKGSPANTVTAISACAAWQSHLHRSYDLARECDISPDGRYMRLGEDVTLEGFYPEYRLRVRCATASIALRIRNTDKVAWFSRRTGIYNHLSLLSHYEGEIVTGSDTISVSGQCTFEYAAAVAPHPWISAPPARDTRRALSLFTYQIVNFANGQQLLLVDTRASKTKTVLRKAYLRSDDSHGTVYHDAKMSVAEYQEEVAPDGYTMFVPKRWSWELVDEHGSIQLHNQLDTSCYYGLGVGYVAGFAVAAEFAGQPVQGRGYLEYISVE